MKILRFVLLVVLLAAGGLWFFVRQPYGAFQSGLLLDLPHGTGTRVIGQKLVAAGVLRYAWEFSLVRALRPSARLQAGEYGFKDPASAWDIFDRMVRGDVHYFEVTIPEGSNVFEIAALVGEAGTMEAKDFLKATANPASIHDLDPAAKSLEGYLFPSTYRLTRSTRPEQLARQMTDQFRKQWKVLAPGKPSHDTVTLASLVEKETGTANERPKVASVFQNRLNIKMKLDCDPTTIYAALLDQRFKGVIHRSDLASDNAYNTYTHPGLPPGPIANPGLAALKAALQPAETKYLFFVAKLDGSGGHQFSATLAEHQAAVQAYRARAKAAKGK